MFSGLPHVPENDRLKVDAFLQKGKSPNAVLDKIRELLATPTKPPDDTLEATRLEFCQSEEREPATKEMPHASFLSVSLAFCSSASANQAARRLRSGGAPVIS
jgi:hypothetical protein